ncbi:unnamed protein product [Arabidopsis arenosa]|uniref:SWIM-type domain-containing protein n=1 Tax=Arabidopsis arenosa TaxID=38785 RepID=A0A8S2A1M4_ARAAE|nr:unnamed protein product [Arabidopsis arenosa]
MMENYIAVLLGPTEEIYISDDEDVGVYISSGENNRRYVLNVDVITPPELPEQLSRVELLNKSYVGKNYVELDSNEDEMRDSAAIILCECEEQGTVSNEAIVENYLHDLWVDAEKLKVTELNTFQLEYNVTSSEGKEYSVNLLLKTCSCKVFDIQKYHCVHALAGFIAFESDTTRTRVPDRSQWDIPDDIKALKVLPLPQKKKKGRTKVLRFPSTGKRRPKRQRTQNKRRSRQSLQWDPWYDERKNVKRIMDQLEEIGMMEGIPKRCPCGGRILDKISENDGDKGKRYYQCNVYKNDGLHIRKLWDKAMVEEVTRLREEVDNHHKNIQSLEYYQQEMRSDLKGNGKEIQKLKELVAHLAETFVVIEELMGLFEDGCSVEDGSSVKDGSSVEDGCCSVEDGCCSVIGTPLFLFNPVFFGGIIGNEKTKVTKEKRNSKI